MVNDGVMLMNHLKYEVDKIPDALFLDLNMPRKTGFECLAEIKQHHKLKQLPVIIFSTSFDNTIANKLHEQGAHFYIRKPAEFSDLKNIISESLKLLLQYPGQPGKEKFVLNSR